MRRVRLRHEARHVQHESVVRARGVGLDLCEDGLQEVVVVDLGIQAVRREAAQRARDEAQALLVVDRGLVLGEDDEGRSFLVEARIHAGCDLRSARESEADVGVLLHVVGLERALDLAADVGGIGDRFETQGPGRVDEPFEVACQAKNAALVDAQALPAAVATLDEGVEDADLGLGAGEELAVNVDQDVLVPGVVGLLHA